MVSILPNNARSPWDIIGQSIGANVSQNLPGAIQQGYNRGQLQGSLANIQNISKDPNASPLDITLAAMQAGAGIPGSERYMAALIPELVKFAEARRSQGVKLPGEEGVQGQRESMPMPQQAQPLPEFFNQKGQQQQNSEKFFPTNIGSQEAPGNVPQAATTGQAVPLLTPSEKRVEAKRLSKESTAAGIPLTPTDALKEVERAEEDKRLHNETVERERQQRVASQQNYGEKAANELLRVYPEATSEQQAIFAKKGEQAASEGKSEADINRYLANEAKNFKNAIAGVKNDISAPRLYNEMIRRFQGNHKDFDRAASDLRTRLKPILDLGLYDTARNLLEERGYAPEERESIINPMSERQQTAMNKIPKVEKISKPGLEPAARKVNLENIAEGLAELKQIDPNFSLVLARKAFEDKGYESGEFKAVLDEMVNQGFELSDDQRNQLDILGSPPLRNLDKIFEFFKIIGR